MKAKPKKLEAKRPANAAKPLLSVKAIKAIEKIIRGEVSPLFYVQVLIDQGLNHLPVVFKIYCSSNHGDPPPPPVPPVRAA